MRKHSFVISTNATNLYKTLDPLLKSISAAVQESGEGFSSEVIVVVNKPLNRSEELSPPTNIGLPLRVVHEGAIGLVFARHKGFRASNSDLITFLDDDVQISPSYFWGLKELPCTSILLAGGNVLPYWEECPPQFIYDLYSLGIGGYKAIPSLTILEVGHDPCYIDPMYIWGCNFTVSRELLLKANGFHPDAFPPQQLHLRGDGETHIARICASLKGYSYFHPALTVMHNVPKARMSLQYLRKRWFAEGVSASYLSVRGNGIDVNSDISVFNLNELYQQIIMKAGNGPLKFNSEIKSLLDLEHQNGYAWHRKCVAENPWLIKWCRLTTYGL